MSITLPDGTLVRTDGQVYVVVGGERHAIPADELAPEPQLESGGGGALSAVLESGGGGSLGAVLELPPADAEAMPLASVSLTQGLIEASREDEVRSDMPRRYLSSTVRLSPDQGRIDGDTRTWTRQPWFGFTGGVLVLLANEQGQIIHSTQLVQFGVDGFRVPFKQWTRQDHWVQQVPVEVSRAARSLEIVHSHAPKNRLMAIVAEGIQLFRTALEVAAELRRLGPI